MIAAVPLCWLILHNGVMIHTYGRCGDDIDGGLLNEIITMLRKLNMYNSHFEGPFLDQTNEFYRVKGDIQLNDSSVSNWSII